MKKIIMILVSSVFICTGQCHLCDVADPETTWTDPDNYVIHYVVNDTVRQRYDTLFVDTVGEFGLKWKKIARIDTAYLHTDFDMRLVSRGKEKYTGKWMRIILK
jgi:hypothetical protein